MINNSTNLNKTKNHLKSLNIKKTKTYDIGNPDSGLGHAQQYGGAKPINVYLIHPSRFTVKDGPFGMHLQTVFRLNSILMFVFNG
jgi:hypothetical protein